MVMIEMVHWVRGRKAIGKPVQSHLCAARRSQSELHPARQQSSSHKVQIGQREHGKRLYGVLGQAAVTNFGETPQALHHMESVLATRSTPRSGSVDTALILGQPMVARWPAVDAVAYSGVLAVLPISLPIPFLTLANAPWYIFLAWFLLATGTALPRREGDSES